MTKAGMPENTTGGDLLKSDLFNKAGTGKEKDLERSRSIYFYIEITLKRRHGSSNQMHRQNMKTSIINTRKCLVSVRSTCCISVVNQP
jgi:hypothetical protein